MIALTMVMTLKDDDDDDDKDEDEDEAEDDDVEDVGASAWVAPNGTTYLRTEDGTLWDLTTHEQLGEWDDEKDELRPFDDEDDEE